MDDVVSGDFLVFSCRVMVVLIHKGVCHITERILGLVSHIPIVKTQFISKLLNLIVKVDWLIELAE